MRENIEAKTLETVEVIRHRAGSVKFPEAREP